MRATLLPIMIGGLSEGDRVRSGDAKERERERVRECVTCQPVLSNMYSKYVHTSIIYVIHEHNTTKTTQVARLKHPLLTDKLSKKAYNYKQLWQCPRKLTIAR